MEAKAKQEVCVHLKMNSKILRQSWSWFHSLHFKHEVLRDNREVSEFAVEIKQISSCICRCRLTLRCSKVPHFLSASTTLYRDVPLATYRRPLTRRTSDSTPSARSRPTTVLLALRASRGRVYHKPSQTRLPSDFRKCFSIVFSSGVFFQLIWVGYGQF